MAYSPKIEPMNKTWVVAVDFKFEIDPNREKTDNNHE